MNLYQGLRIGVLEIRSHKMQSFLTLFGIAVGITSVTAMTGIMSSLQNQMSSSIRRSGPGRLFIWPRSTNKNRDLSAGLVYEDALAIRRNFPDIPTVSPSIRGQGNLFMDDFRARVQVRGVTPEWNHLDWNYKLEGRFFNDEDMKTSANVCVLIKRRHDPTEFWRQKDLLEPLFRHDALLGKEVRIEQNAFRVVGILHEGPRNNMMNFEMGSKNVLVPFTSYQKRLADDKKQLYLVDLDSGDQNTSDLLAKRVFALLKRRHRGVEDFKVENIAEQMGAAMKWANTLATVMGAVAAIALFAGGVGIMNITLASVSARIKEIGIRKSIGARERDIQLQFLLEAIVLSMTGGALGVLLGSGICYLMKTFAHFSAMPPLLSILAGLIVSTGVGLIFSWYPARQAAQLDPVEALRYE